MGKNHLLPTILNMIWVSFSSEFDEAVSTHTDEGLCMYLSLCEDVVFSALAITEFVSL